MEVLSAFLSAFGAFGWPTATLLMVVFLVTMFRSNIAGVVDSLRGRGFKVPGVDVAGPQQQSQPVGDSAVNDTTREMASYWVSPLVENAAKAAREKLQTIAFKDAADRETWIFREIAQLDIKVNFEQLYRNIFGSQLTALRALNTTSASIPDLLEKLYANAKASNPAGHANTNFDGWLSYLTSNGLVAVDGNRVHITPKGRAFLSYVVDQGYPDIGWTSNTQL